MGAISYELSSKKQVRKTRQRLGRPDFSGHASALNSTPAVVLAATGGQRVRTATRAGVADGAGCGSAA